MVDQPSLDPLDAFAELSRVKGGETDLDGVLTRLANLAKRSIPGATEASVTLVRGAGPHTAARTGDLARTLDERQYAEGGGPCLHAALAGATVSIPRMTVAGRWPLYLRRALDAGIGSSLSVGLPAHETMPGSVNLYSAEPGAFDEDAVLIARAFAGFAAVAWAHAHLDDTTAILARHIRAMDDRTVATPAR